MSHHDQNMPGAAPVSRVEVLDAQSLFLITALRNECLKRPREAEALWEGFALNVGVERAQNARNCFDNLMALFSRHGRRALATHDGRCSCVCADEAVFTQFITHAASGEPEDAMMMGMLLLRADIVPLAVSVAQQVGLLTRVPFEMHLKREADQAPRAYH